MGTAFYYIQGYTGLSQDYMFRGFQYPQFDVRNIVLNTIRTTLLQAHEIHRHVGGFVLATAFFLSLLHPFKRSSISNYRWSIVVMWIFASIGMAIYGLSNDPIEPNQMHILFMPLMTAFALALISILWARIPYSQEGGFVALTPFIIIIVIAASPMLIKLQTEFKSNAPKTVNGYLPNNTNRDLTEQLETADIVYSDQPWAVAWYADHVAIWTPYSQEDFEKINEITEQTNNNIAAVHVSPLRTGFSTEYKQAIDNKFSYPVDLVGTKKGPFYIFSKTKPKDE